jgi:ABC-type amino acid transport substrate-binding protein
MKKHLAIAGLLVLAGTTLFTSDLLACGDKFLVVSRGTRFQRAVVPRRPDAILVYANPAAALPKTLASGAVDAMLRKAGYRPTTVVNAEELETALQQGGWDLVLVDVADSQSVSSRLRGDRTPVVLPVVYQPTGPEFQQAKKQYANVLKSPAKSQALLEAIDDALAATSRAQAKAENRPSR